MSLKATLRLGLSGPHLEKIARGLLHYGFFKKGVPTMVLIEAERKKITPRWFEAGVKKYKRLLGAEWEGEGILVIHKNDIIKLVVNQFDLDVPRMLSILEGLRFELASFFYLYDEWEDEEHDLAYDGPGFGNLHWPHGWACAFQGKGHDQLVSRRWLEHGPWRLVRGANDTSLIQFHDLEADAATALAQAKPGHERMGVSEVGGFMPIPYESTHEISGLYHPDERALKIVVAGRDVSQQEMTDACAVRRFQMLGDDKPLDSVAYVFIEEATARKHLHELWLRELECWTVEGAREVRLDKDYNPTPKKPKWVREVEKREGAS